ncbi:hypothetical protein AOCH_004250 [Aspergillus ochraceoroseus]|uniref:RNA-dependent RNA polymerase n=2 Tax=Aspergillus ochraceoroseus TaxID=138278 RepID=A0A0F8U4J9_9EURO|nr:hypothetical protein AOCH_004250 [Aspergillus ochraceoroseus]
MQAAKVLRERIAQPGFRLTYETAGAAMALSYFNLASNNIESAFVHLNGLIQLLELKQDEDTDFESLIGLANLQIYIVFYQIRILHLQTQIAKLEVFIHNLPIDLSEDGLKEQLAPFMRRLAIFDYTCDKPRKKRYGFITFLTRDDGENFLASHKEWKPNNGLGKPNANLQLLGADVYCKYSNRKPQEFVLKALAHAVEQRRNPSLIIEEEGNSISFPLLRYSCGYSTFLNARFTYIPEVQWGDSGTITFKNRNIIVKLNNMRLIRIPLSTVVELVWNSRGSFVLTLSTVPFFFQSTLGATRSRLCSLGGKHPECVGQCLVYQFCVSDTDFFKKMQNLKEYSITLTFYDFETTYQRPLHTQMIDLKDVLGTYTKEGTLPFGILFQLQALAFNAFLPADTIIDLTKELAAIFKARKTAGIRPISMQSVGKLFNLIDWPDPFGEPRDFTTAGLLQMISETSTEFHAGIIQSEILFRPSQNLAQIYRATVTPSRITLHGPELEAKNRILRRFPNHHEYFLRVQFCDENGQDIHFTPQVSNEDIFSRFKNTLKNGIQIAGRTYTFLGFSHSSLRSHSVWFCAPFVDDNGNLQTYFSIIKALGDFSSITSPARCAARIGQAFSETPFAINLKENFISVDKIHDVTSTDGSRVFSDGVGTISLGAVEAIRDMLPLKKGIPTCFQIRLGGAKGMLSLNTSLNGSRIHLRPSMIKFDSKDMGDLEICDMASKPIPLVLNRQVIKILEDMGVPEAWFYKLQKIRVDQLRNATATTKNTAKFLKRQDVGGPIRLHKLFLEFSRLGLEYKRVPFIRSIVEAVILRELRLLKHKARIPVEKGITLFGIMDETGFLKENQVYVTFDTMGDRFLPPPGNCRLLVTRCPSLYDGDIQYVSNQLPPKDHPLTAHRNCIVFSQRGQRDLPSKLSGGDLDGDLYNIIWDPEAAPTQVFAPADYPRIDPLDIGRLVKKEDMGDFFVDFMQSDLLGVIATKHMILADQMELGTSHSDCKKLAQLHSTAVDFSKTGVPVKLNEMPIMNRCRPDFFAPGPQAYIHNKSDVKMEPYLVQPNPNEDEDSGPVHKYYRSEKILGKLYRSIDEHKIWKEDIRLIGESISDAPWVTLIQSLTARCRAVGAPTNWKAHRTTAEQIRAVYEDAISATMNNFSEHPTNPISELEVFIGHILNKTGVQTRRQRERSIKLKDEFDRIVTWILEQMRPRPRGPLTGYATEFDSLERCLACTYIIEDTAKSRTKRSRRKWYELESFRVVAVYALLLELEFHEKKAQEQEQEFRKYVFAATGDLDEVSRAEVDKTMKEKYGIDHTLWKCGIDFASLGIDDY